MYISRTRWVETDPWNAPESNTEREDLRDDTTQAASRIKMNISICKGGGWKIVHEREETLSANAALVHAYCSHGKRHPIKDIGVGILGYSPGY